MLNQGSAFAMCFNSFGGMKILFPMLVKWLGRAEAKTHDRLTTEVHNHGRGEVTMRTLGEMPLVKSKSVNVTTPPPPELSHHHRP
jgi:hydroperoxide dehydratase